MAISLPVWTARLIERSGQKRAAPCRNGRQAVGGHRSVLTASAESLRTATMRDCLVRLYRRTIRPSKRKLPDTSPETQELEDRKGRILVVGLSFRAHAELNHY